MKIIKKSVKETEKYCIKNLFVTFQEEEIYDNIVSHLLAKGATTEQIEKFCKPNEYNNSVSYSFGLNCSNYTFEKVERFGILEANIIFALNEKGFINAKIQIENKKEQVLSYDAPESNVDGWVNDNDSKNDNTTEINDNKENDISQSGIDDLPF
ncbi:MAG TPA: hypothetical protein DC057_03505 [Spirochaetia bacterium]|nr:hypothetical protein [Spirochaetia bacterium]